LRRVFSPVSCAFGANVTLTRRDVENIAHLARLRIDDQELPVYVGSLSRILEFVEQLGSASTDEVEPMAHPLEDQVQRLQEAAHSASDAVRSQVHHAREVGDEWTESLRGSVRNHPLAAVATALAIGAVIARLTR